MTNALSIGSISNGSHLACDLIPAFADALQTVELTNEDASELADILRIVNAINECDDEDTLDAFYASDWAIETVNETLPNMLNSYCPAYCYFGTSEGDGSDFGVWVSWDSINDDEDVLKVGDTSDVPSDYTGDVMHINDHGNATLYAAQDGVLTEVWSVV